MRFEVFFSGTVQGVGFRYNAKQISREFDIVGSVENLPDGRVKLVAEGAEDQIEQFIERICETTHGRVTETAVQRRGETGQFSGFEILR